MSDLTPEDYRILDENGRAGARAGTAFKQALISILQDGGITCARCHRSQQPPGNGWQPPDQQLCAACAVELGKPVMAAILHRFTADGFHIIEDPDGPPGEIRVSGGTNVVRLINLGE